MEKLEYNAKLIELENEFSDKKKALNKEYALSNSPYKVGDVFTDHNGTVRIEKISVEIDFSSRFPICVYYGRELKKDLTPTKKELYRWAWQSNDIKRNNL